MSTVMTAASIIHHLAQKLADLRLTKMTHIFVISDDKTMRKVIRVNVEMRGFEVTETTPDETLDCLDRNRPSTVILCLPYYSARSRSLLHSLATHPTYAQLPVVVVTTAPMT